MSNNIQLLEKQLQQATNKYERIDALNDLGWALAQENRIRAFELAQEALQLSSKPDVYQRGLALSLRTKARLASHETKYDEALTFALEALSYQERINDVASMPPTLHIIATTYRKLGNPSAALEHQFKQLDISQQLNDQANYARSLTGVGISYHDMGNYPMAQTYFEKSLTAFRQVENSYGISMALNNLSYFHVQMGNYEQALQWGKESLTIAHQNKHVRMQVSVSNTLGEAYLHLNDIENALAYLQDALTTAKSENLLGHEIDALKLIGRIHYQRQDTDQAISYLTQALQLGEQAQHKQYIYEAHQWLAETYKLMGNFQKALNHHEQFHTIKESVFNEESSKKLQNLEVLYRAETSQKEAEYYATLYQSEQSRHRLTEILSQVAQALTDTLDLQEILGQILEKLHTLVDYDHGALLLWHDEHLEFVSIRGQNPQTPTLNERLQTQLDDVDNLFVKIYHEQKPIALTHAAEYQGTPNIATLFAPGSWLGVPLIRHQKVIGLLSLGRKKAQAYQEDAIMVASTIANQAAVAIENARLFEQAEHRADKMTTLVQVGHDIVSTLDLSIVLERIVDHSHKLFNANTTILQLLDNDKQTFRSIVMMGQYADQFKTTTTILGEGITGNIAQTSIAEIINDIEKDPRAIHVEGTPEEEDTPVSLMCSPIIANETSIGLLLLYRDKVDGLFAPGDLHFLEGLSGQAAIAIENAQLYDQVKRFNEQLEQEVVRRTVDLQTAYQQLEKLDRSKSDFIAVTAHELRTPITVLQGYCQILEQDSLIKQHTYQNNLVTGIATGAERLRDIVNTMLIMVKIDNSDLNLRPEPLAIKQVIRAVDLDLSNDIARRQQTFEVDESIQKLPPVAGDSESLLLVFTQLVVNAIKYTPDGGRIWTHGRIPPPSTYGGDDSPLVEIIISDTGIGIAPQMQELIFTKFYQTGEITTHSSSRTQFKGGGPGLGLAIAQGIIEAHQGRIWVESDGHDEEKCRGSHFHILLPIYQGQPKKIED